MSLGGQSTDFALRQALINRGIITQADIDVAINAADAQSQYAANQSIEASDYAAGLAAEQNA